MQNLINYLWAKKKLARASATPRVKNVFSSLKFFFAPPTRLNLINYLWAKKKLARASATPRVKKVFSSLKFFFCPTWAKISQTWFNGWQKSVNTEYKIAGAYFDPCLTCVTTFSPYEYGIQNSRLLFRPLPYITFVCKFMTKWPTLISTPARYTIDSY